MADYTSAHRWGLLSDLQFHMENTVGVLVYQKVPHPKWPGYFRLNLGYQGKAVCKGALGKTVKGVDMIALDLLEKQCIDYRDKGHRAKELYGKSLFIDADTANTVRCYAKLD